MQDSKVETINTAINQVANTLHLSIAGEEDITHFDNETVENMVSDLIQNSRNSWNRQWTNSFIIANIRMFY